MTLGANTTNTVVLPTTLDFTPSDDLQMITEENLDAKHIEKSKTGQDHEECLESHEVIEINKFTERKEWIEEKIKFLENMPPVQVFANVDAFASFPEEMPPGLPTRAQHGEWLREHDKIEKETEIFDARDMSKLKKFTKAATQRNLSPEDTDLIEVTLTTLLALDKLLHLLRDRSEQLELLGLRLTWEEQRIIAWKERRQILEDIKSFLTTRARWSVDVYASLTDQGSSPYMGSRFMSPPPGPARPSSALSLRRDSVASISSESSTAGLNLPSRSARYRLAETLSHDAAILSGRLTTLNHAKVVAAGKTLDKFIDISRKPVPDEILDEQDALEDKAVKELESVGKFMMAVVMQWKRADEYYSDIIKDQGGAKALLSEVANANLQHPSQRLDSSFMTRAQALTKRLALKANPKNSFLRPLHVLFPDQASANDTLVEALNVEFTDAIELAQRAEANALEYHQKVKAVKQAEDVLIGMNGLCDELGMITEQLMGHMQTSNEHGDPTPPNLQNESCLEATKHAAYVALAPAIFRKFEELDSSSESLLPTATQNLLRLKSFSGIDNSFQVSLATTIQQLQSKRQETKTIKERMEVTISQLKEAKRLWVVLNNIMDSTENIASQVANNMKIQRWKPLGNIKHALPVTPDSDSPSTIPVIPIVLVPNDLLTALTALNEKSQLEFLIPFQKLQPSLATSLSTHLQSSFEGVSSYIRNAFGSIKLWQSIVDQSIAMTDICRETEELIHNIVVLQSEIEDLQDKILRGDASIDTFDTDESQFSSRIKELDKPIGDFIAGFPKRIPLVSRHVNIRQNSRSNSTSASDYYLHRLKEPSDLEPSVDIVSLNNDIRDDSNGFALKLSNAMDTLNRSQQGLNLSGIAIRTDRLIENLERISREMEGEITALRSLVDASLPSERAGISSQILDQLTAFAENCEDISNRYTALMYEPVQGIREALKHFESVLASRSNSPFCTGVISNRLKSGKGALEHANDVELMLVRLKGTLEIEKSNEQQRLSMEKEQISRRNHQKSEGRLNAADFPESPDLLEAFEEDVFGTLTPMRSIPSNLINLQSRIMSLKSSLRSFNDNVSMSCYSNDVSAMFPSLEQIDQARSNFSTLENEINGLPPKVNHPDVNTELNSIRSELDKSRTLLERLGLLGEVSKKITVCDNAFSDLLEHIDNYPAPPPIATLASDHSSDSFIPCEEQLKARLIYCTDQMDSVAQAAVTLNDSRVLNEQARLRQTLLELRAMCIDRINGTHSRPASTASSSRSASVVGGPIASTPKSKPVLDGKTPKAPKRFPFSETDRSSRRSVSGSQDPVRPSARPSDRSHTSNRSVSGPSMTSSLFSPTFASRQRTTSLASTSRATPPAIRPRTLSKRPVSPTHSEMSGRSRPSTSRGSWARAPRQSFGSTLRGLSAESRKRETYVPNPKSKLDVAVGHVVNNFKLPVTVQIAEEGWKDQSGKYWIGDAEPKLCFCRILRSQTVMVRVGGGWSELSKFLKGHFADLLAELPPSPPKNEEKWISPRSLREAGSPIPTVLSSPRTPESKLSSTGLPSLQLSTPSGTSPRSIRTTSTTPDSKSPTSLTPFQYMRRADATVRPSTPSSKSSLRSSLKPNDTPTLHRAITPPRPHVWRP